MTFPLPRQAQDLTGKRKGTWTAVEVDPSTKPGVVRWRLRCDCGNEKVVAAGNWRSQSVWRCEVCTPRKPNYNQLAPGESSFNLLFSRYAYKASKRGIPFELSIEEFRSLTKQPCSYCGLLPTQVARATHASAYVYTGIDRVDPAGAYVSGNVVPCCGICNRCKSDLPLDEWREHIRRLYERLCKW